MRPTLETLRDAYAALRGVADGEPLPLPLAVEVEACGVDAALARAWRACRGLTLIQAAAHRLGLRRADGVPVPANHSRLERWRGGVHWVVQFQSSILYIGWNSDDTVATCDRERAAWIVPWDGA